jgi:uncharacterized membrane protein
MDIPARPRRAYIDWVRGVAVVIMVFAHTMDSWTRDADRAASTYGFVVKVAGMGAPLFLFLAGISVAFAGAARIRRGETLRQAGAGVRRRGWQILGLALLFRIQAWALSPGATLAGILKVDILNVMGPALALAATIWALSARFWPRVLALGAMASVFSLLTPSVRASASLSALPDFLEWYVRPPQGRSWFAMFPWAGLLLAGTIVGEILERSRDESSERRTLAWLAIGGTLVFAASWIGSYFPSLYANTYFWTTSPAYFFLRIGLMTLSLPLAWLWCRRLQPGRFSPMLQFGRTSLFIYWIHVEMVYGILSWPLHRALPMAWAFVAFLTFTALMLWVSIAKERIVSQWGRGQRPRVGVARQAGVDAT